ncbi:hypothetical protein VHEMI06411 [[Torrubiella] hemipterigena]|uniref:Uncharacterized protein n=1 Tax=[Torrubiella] hemipterigena TaxID=1531966 RepID=A0A0A1TJC8_9HYPO|nr:hypothetical protein VHEMI06411 [[Torrubiella] hemipterigena]
MTITDQPASSFPFLGLPSEIQYKICTLFCRHCQPAASPFATLFAPAGAPFQALKALSETCHSLKEMAQPILYHYPDVKSYTSFFKAVIARPDLAASVRVFARYYEADRSPYKSSPSVYSREDTVYLIQLGQKFGLEEDGNNRDSENDFGPRDDVNFKRCFEYLEDTPIGDQEGYTMMISQAAYYSFLTALHFAILPRLEFVMIDIEDGRSWVRSHPLSSGRLLLTYPYLKQAIAGNPDHFSHLNAVVFRSSFHYREESLGLESVAYMLSAIPNVRVVFFDMLRGMKPRSHQDPDLFPEPPELSWSVLPQLQEIYFDPCARPKSPPPIAAISNMLQRCSRLKKLVYRHKYPDQFTPTTLFSPTKLCNAIASTQGTLQHLEIYCSSAKIPLFASEQLIDYRLKDFTTLKTLALDEELFCKHWHKEAYLDSDACLVRILPDNISSLTVRLHDKFKAVPDIIRLGRDKALGHYPKLSSLEVHILHDADAPDDHHNVNQVEEAFDSEYLLHAIPPKKWEETLRELADKIRPAIVTSFQDTDVVVDVRYVYERLFSWNRMPWRQ